MKKFAFVFVMLAGMLWGVIGIFVRQYQGWGVNALDIVQIRGISALMWMGLWMLLFRRSEFKIRIKDLWCFIGTGLFSVVFFNFCYFNAMKMISLSVASVLLYTAPVIVILLSRIIFQELITKEKIVAFILTFVGCIFVTGMISGQGHVTLPGLLAGLGAGFGYALYSIFSRFAIEKGYSSLTISFYTFVVATISLIPFTNMKEIVVNYYGQKETVIWSLLFGLISTMLPYLCYTIGLNYMENGKAAVIASIEPVVATAVGFFVFHEKITMQQLLGILLVLGGIALCNLNGLKRKIKE